MSGRGGQVAADGAVTDTEPGGDFGGGHVRVAGPEPGHGGGRPDPAGRTGMSDAFMQAAVEEARQGRIEGGIPIGSVLVHAGRIILGRGHNRRVQRGSAVLHGDFEPPLNRLGCFRAAPAQTTLQLSQRIGAHKDRNGFRITLEHGERTFDVNL